MNPEAGYIEGPFRETVMRIARENPRLPAPEVISRARREHPAANVIEAMPVTPPSPRTLQHVETLLNLTFGEPA